MKLKNKILLAAAGLLVVSGAAATTGTFAWFTAASTAKTTATTMTAMSDTTALNLACTTSDPSLILTGDKGADSVNHDYVASYQASTGEGYNSANQPMKLTDISGNGATFYKASTSGIYDSAGALTSVIVGGTTQVTSRVAPYVYQFKLVFTSTNATGTNGGNELAIFLDPATSKILDHGAETVTKDTGAVRVGFSKSAAGTTDGDQVAYYAPNDDVDDTANSGATPMQYYNGTAADATRPCTSDNVKNIMDKDFNTKYTETTASVTTASTGYLGTTAGTTGLVLYMNIWLEGQDTDCVNGNEQSFDVAMHFYGLNRTVSA